MWACLFLKPQALGTGRHCLFLWTPRWEQAETTEDTEQCGPAASRSAPRRQQQQGPPHPGSCCWGNYCQNKQAWTRGPLLGASPRPGNTGKEWGSPGAGGQSAGGSGSGTPQASSPFLQQEVLWESHKPPSEELRGCPPSKPCPSLPRSSTPALVFYSQGNLRLGAGYRATAP